MILYIERDQYGKICAVYPSARKNIEEKKRLLDKEVVDFLQQNHDERELERLLSFSDLSTVRVLEDVIDLLIKKNIIKFTDLPEAAQLKICERKRVRQTLSETNIIVDDVL